MVLGPNVEPGVPNLYFTRALHQVSPFLTFGRLVEGGCKVPLVLRLSQQTDRTGGKCVQSPFGAKAGKMGEKKEKWQEKSSFDNFSQDCCKNVIPLKKFWLMDGWMGLLETKLV